MVRLLRLLETDAAPTVPLTIAIDFREADHRSKHVRDGRVGAWSVAYFEDPWLTLSGRFQDGSAFRIAMVERQQNRKKTKYSRSGKMKTKHKTKASSQALVQLRPKAKRYGQLDTLGRDARRAVQLPRDLDTKRRSCH